LFEAAWVTGCAAERGSVATGVVDFETGDTVTGVAELRDVDDGGAT
jgi:hypothetical protein